MLTKFGGQIGKILLKEGIEDLIYSFSCAVNGGHFSWKDYGIVKAFSIGTKFVALGIKFAKYSINGGGGLKEFLRNPVEKTILS